MEARQIVLQTRQLFETTHWTKGRMRAVIDGKSMYCLIGGLRLTAMGDAMATPDEDGEYFAALAAIAESALDEHDVRHLIREAEGKYFEYLEDPLITWNDTADTTLDAVIDALNAAAARLPERTEAT